MRSLIFLLVSFSCLAKFTTPTKLYNGSINFADDISFENVELAVSRQIKTYERRYNLNDTITLGDRVYKLSVLKDSLLAFQDIAVQARNCLKNHSKDVCNDQLNQSISQKFDVYTPDLDENDPRFGDEKPALYTTYYSPDFEGSFTKTEKYNNPIYTMPSDENLRKSTRVQIDFEGVLAGKGLELFYVKESIYDKYLLHIEGGGRVKVYNEGGSYKKYYLSYQGSNGQSFRFIHNFLRDSGYMSGDFSIMAQRKFMNDNPELGPEIYSTCPSYIYFKVTEDEPVGIDMIPLTEKRSIALDRKFYKASGLLTFVQSKMPIEQQNKSNAHLATKDFSRFFIHQDTGGAIKGKARADLYAGFGPKAEFLANYLHYQGTMYFLVLKQDSKSQRK